MAGIKIQKTSQNKGGKHEYLGITFDYLHEGKVKLTMEKFLANAVEACLEPIVGTATSPGRKDLFTVDDKDNQLKPKMANNFYRIVAKLMFAGKRASPDLQRALAFLSTQVNNPCWKDWKKLVRFLKYINGALEMPLTLEPSAGLFIYGLIRKIRI